MFQMVAFHMVGLIKGLLTAMKQHKRANGTRSHSQVLDDINIIENTVVDQGNAHENMGCAVCIRHLKKLCMATRDGAIQKVRESKH